MIAYFDTSAIIPLLIVEPGTETARTMWAAADRAVSVRLVYPETRAALTQAQRLGRLSRRQHRSAVEAFEHLFEQIDLVELDDVLARRAGDLAEAHGLRGYDSVHLAAALRVADAELVMVAGDAALLAAASAAGLPVAALP